MILADTSVWIDYVNGIASPRTDLLDRELQRDRVATGDLIIAEFLHGFRDDAQFRAAAAIMESLEYHDIAGRAITYKAAENFCRLRKCGITVRKTIDVLIATFCIENRFELLHSDRDFDPMEDHLGLKVRR
jgi:predicted nucleic acid-binding protein